MKKIALILSILFILLTFLGSGYVLLNHGTVNAGYGLIPLVFALACIAFYRQKK